MGSSSSCITECGGTSELRCCDEKAPTNKNMVPETSLIYSDSPAMGVFLMGVWIIQPFLSTPIELQTYFFEKSEHFLVTFGWFGPSWNVPMFRMRLQHPVRFRLSAPGAKVQWATRDGVADVKFHCISLHHYFCYYYHYDNYYYCHYHS